MRFNPDPSETLSSGDVLVAMGKEEDLQRLERTCEGAS
jgi:K+/H+ antiporter YhaU regulatory subunit KhtT